MALPFSSPGPILLDLGFTQIRWYGLMTALGCLTGIYIAGALLKYRAEKENLEISFDDFSNFALVAVFTGIIGARLWFVLLNIQYYLQHPLESYQIWLGGQSIQGGLMGAIIGTWFYSKHFQKQANGKDFNIFTTELSSLAVAAPLGQAIGRWGNFFNEEAFGSVTELPWALYISHTGKYHHPTFLYEMIWNLISFIILYSSHKKLKNLQCIGLYLILYSSGRILIESLRTDSLYIGSIKAASLISFLSLIAGLVLLLQRGKDQ